MIVNRREHFCVSRVRSCLLHTVTINLIMSRRRITKRGMGISFALASRDMNQCVGLYFNVYRNDANFYF